MVITFFAASIVAVNAIGIPSYAYSRVIKSPTLEFVIAVSSTFLIASENVSVTLDSMGIPVAVSSGSKFTLGAVASAVVNVDEDDLLHYPIHPQQLHRLPHRQLAHLKTHLMG